MRIEVAKGTRIDVLNPPTLLSVLGIDVNKDWGGYRIENLGAPTATGHALRRGDEGLIDHDTLLNYVAAEHLRIKAGIARQSSITLPAGMCMWLAWDVVAGSFISSKVLPWWNQGGTTLDISNIAASTTAGDIVSSFACPDAFPRGLTWDGNNLWHADLSAAKIFELTTTGTIVSSFASPDWVPKGLTWDGKNLWNADSGVDMIFELTTTGTIVSSFASPDATPKGLTWDGNNLWNVDHTAGKIFELKDGKRNVRYIAVEAA